MAEHGDAGERASALARKLNAIREPRLRRFALADTLRDEPAGVTVATLHALLMAHRTRPTPEATAALETLGATLSVPDLVSYPVRAELYEAAKASGFDEVARMLFEASAANPPEPGDAAAAERPLQPRGRPLTLGERKSLARGRVRDLLEVLVKDPHPDVIAILLGNPHLTERDVLAIATRRPAPPETLALIATSERWASRYAVKRALVLNPYTPPHLGVRLVVTLSAGDLRAVVNDPNLAEPVRSQAEALLAA